MGLQGSSGGSRWWLLVSATQCQPWDGPCAWDGSRKCPCPHRGHLGCFPHFSRVTQPRTWSTARRPKNESKNQFPGSAAPEALGPGRALVGQRLCEVLGSAEAQGPQTHPLCPPAQRALGSAGASGAQGGQREPLGCSHPLSAAPAGLRAHVPALAVQLAGGTGRW